MDYKQDFKTRYTSLAEDKCEEYLKAKDIEYKRFGWDFLKDPISSTNFFKLPNNMRSLPDFIIFTDKAYFVEVKGCKYFLRIKHDDMKVYTFWDKIMDLFFFVYSSVRNKIYKLSYSDINDITKHCETKVYPDNNKKYFLIENRYLEERG